MRRGGYAGSSVGRSGGDRCQVSHRQETGEWRAYPPFVRAQGLLPGFLAILILLCFGVGLGAAVISDDSDNYGYYDGDGDDAVAAPERLAVLVDLVVGARGEATPVRTSEVFEGPAIPLARPIVRQSLSPLLRSPPIT